jgi:hypothetical protein
MAAAKQLKAANPRDEGVEGTAQETYAAGVNRMSAARRSAKTFTPKQGQYLAYIYATRACTAVLRPNGTCRNISASARLRFTRWC